ncbi:TPA: hypothetical protein HL383_19155 [Escherichia coli]|nr:hypothetical protein B0915_17695 [Escherichia coli]ETE23991.1 hypothetical protein V415_06680 [Escherichia coli LAU-EC10]OYK74348.1 hypothetical protein CI719_16185 [Shigella boydii]EEY5766896.1 hypothetical protein [Escherichia coli]KUV73816.1 hypothetical protein AWF48_10355 [Escherichia coli]
MILFPGYVFYPPACRAGGVLLLIIFFHLQNYHKKHDCRQIDIFRLVITEYGLALIPAPSAKEKLIQILFSISVI